MGGADQNNLPQSWTRLSATATTYRIENLDPSQTWFVQVRGVSSVGVGENSNTPSAQPLPLSASGPTAPQRLRGNAFYFAPRVFSTFEWEAPASLGEGASGTPTLVRYEYSVNGATWVSNGTRQRTNQLVISNPDTFRVRAISNNASLNHEGDIATLNWTSVSNDWI